MPLKTSNASVPSKAAGLCSSSRGGASAADLSKLKTFGAIGKEVRPLVGDRGAGLFRHEGKGCLTHMWFGVGWNDCEQTRIRVYVDGEATPSIEMELDLGCGIGFSDEWYLRRVVWLGE